MTGKRNDFTGRIPESWLCIDCGINTAPGWPSRREMEQEFGCASDAATEAVIQRLDNRAEVYTVRNAIWQRAGMRKMGGCLCVGCLEKRLGRRLKPKDFDRDNGLNMIPWATERLRKRQGRG